MSKNFLDNLRELRIANILPEDVKMTLYDIIVNNSEEMEEIAKYYDGKELNCLRVYPRERKEYLNNMHKKWLEEKREVELFSGKSGIVYGKLTRGKVCLYLCSSEITEVPNEKASLYVEYKGNKLEYVENLYTELKDCTVSYSYGVVAVVKRPEDTPYSVSVRYWI